MSGLTAVELDNTAYECLSSCFIHEELSKTTGAINQNNGNGYSNLVHLPLQSCT